VNDLPAILEAFEEALVLERELGSRSFDFLEPLRAQMPAAAPAAEPCTKGGDATERVAAKQVATEETTIHSQSPNPSTPLAAPAAPKAPEVPSCEFLFVTEAPVDAASPAGIFLAKMVKAMGRPADAVAVLPACTGHYPNGRAPTPEEIALERPVFEKNVAARRPKCIVLLGRTAAKALLPDAPLRRGMWTLYGSVPAVMTLSPAYVMRFDTKTDPEGLRAAKVELWHTLVAALAKLGLTPPK